MMRATRIYRRRGLTLLELMLALALTTIVLGVVGMAIDINLRALDSRRDVVEDAQLARAILRLIADDLRGAVQTPDIDLSAVSGVVDAAAGALPEGLDTSGLEDAAGDLGIDTSNLSGLLDEATGATQDIAASTEPPPEPGLYGNQYELLIDTSRLPRVDQYQRMITEQSQLALQDIPSDVKTIAYYVVSEANAGLVTAGQVNDENQPQFGLARRVLDRAVSLRASETTAATSLQQVAEIIAPEVIGIEFNYFDGAEWLTEWDSSQQGGLPVAVRIYLAVHSERASLADADAVTIGAGTVGVDTPQKIYSLTVRIPTAKTVVQAQAAGTTSEDMEAVGL
jgi:hypothetical protein